jgi:hypothetical protein
MGRSMGTSPDSIRVVGEADLLDLGRVARSTWQNWLKQGVLVGSRGGLHGEAEVAEVVVLGLLVAAVELRRAKAIWPICRDRVVQECVALPLDEDAHLDAVVDLHTWELQLARDAAELHAATRARAAFPRGRLVLPLAASVSEARRGFWIRAVPERDLAADKRRRARGDTADAARER